MNFNWLGQNVKELIAIGLLGSMDIGSLYLETSLVDIDPQQKFVIKALQVVLSGAIGYYVQKIASKQDIKGYVYSAFRRIADINRSINRAIREVNLVSGKEDQEIRLALAKVGAITKGIADTARSSMHDWAGIFGEEFRILNEIKTLEGEMVESSIPENRLTEIVEQVEELKKGLPLEFKEAIIDYEDWRGEGNPTTNVFDVFQFLERMTGEYGGVNIVVRAYAPIGLPAEEALKHQNKTFFVREDAGMQQKWLLVYDNDDTHLGEIDKEYNMPYFEYRTYFLGLMRFLEMKGMEYETDMGICLRDARFKEMHHSDRSRFILHVPLPVKETRGE